MYSGSEVPLKNITLGNQDTRLGRRSEKSATNLDSDRTEGEVEPSESPTHTNLYSETSKKKNREGKTLEPGFESESAGCEEGKQGNEEQDAVVMSPWITAPPVATLQVLFNPIAEQQVQAFSQQAKEDKYRYGRRGLIL